MTLVDLDISELRHLVRARPPLTVLTGAGASAESGVPTFRGGSESLWRNHDPMELATPHAFIRNPKLVWEFYAERRQTVSQCRPNPAHDALARFERHWKDTWVVTQNIDSLHREAGSRQLIEMHGSLWYVRCTHCRYRDEDRDDDPDLPPQCPDCGHVLRPDVVWFGESYEPDVLMEIDGLLGRGGTFLVIGTSGAVQPASFFGRIARSRGALVVEINPDETLIAEDMDVLVRAPAGRVLPELLRTEGLEARA
ncbi:MAG: NAD-dependent deacetylase [Myxococcota bacterium]